MKRFISLLLIFIFTFSVGKAQPGTVDWSFQTDFNFKTSDRINAVEILPDGKIIIGGLFTIPLINGNAIKNILRLNYDGSLDLSYKTGNGFDKEVYTLVQQPDGKIIAGGDFHSFNSVKCEKIARINSDGSYDITFTPPYFDQDVIKLALQPDNKILLALYDYYGTKFRRFNANGTNDISFLEVSFNKPVEFIALQGQNKIFTGGSITRVDGEAWRCGIVLIKDNGEVNFSFGQKIQMPFFSSVYSMAFQPDGKILAGGSFWFDSFTQKNFCRFNEDGTLDETFKPPLELINPGSIFFVHLQDDGKIILAGVFNVFNRTNSNTIIRLNGDGSLDTTFKMEGFDKKVSFIGQQSKNKIIATGSFNHFNNRILRISTEIYSEFTFSVSPNPTTGNFRINASKPLKLIIISDVMGKEILRTEPHDYYAEIDLTNKSPGLYFVKVFSENETKCLKVLVR